VGALSETEYNLTSYGIWYYGAILDRLVEKLESAIRTIIYLPPAVNEELEELSQLKFVKDFEDIGRNAEGWLNLVRSKALNWDSCRNLYNSAVNWRTSFMERINEFILMKPRLQKLDKNKLIEEIKNLPEDPRIREWLKVDESRIREFQGGCFALIYGLTTAAGFYFIRLCERALRNLYEKIAGEEPKKKTWGEIFNVLEKYYEDKKRPEVLQLLSYLKGIRDKIMHPDSFLTQEEAEALYFYTMDVIRRLRDLLNELEK
jgi:hypothetical protein